MREGGRVREGGGGGRRVREGGRGGTVGRRDGGREWEREAVRKSLTTSLHLISLISQVPAHHWAQVWPPHQWAEGGVRSWYQVQWQPLESHGMWSGALHVERSLLTLSLSLSLSPPSLPPSLPLSSFSPPSLPPSLPPSYPFLFLPPSLLPSPPQQEGVYLGSDSTL